MLIDAQPNVLSESLCNRLIQAIDVADQAGIAQKANEDWRKCTMLALSTGEIVDEFKSAIRGAFNSYKAKLGTTAGNTLNVANVLEWPNIIRYTNEPDQLFHEHADAWNAASCTRQVAFVCYLNDVEIGGATVFPDRGSVVRPIRGSVLIYPAFFTHMHRAEPPVSGPKYCVVTWAHFPPSGYASVPF